MKIKIDGIEINIANPEMNIVEIAKSVGITIPSPCYSSSCKFGCCKGCVIEIDGKINYACCTKPVEGMLIVFDREDLREMRQKNIKQYADNIKKGIISECDCSEEGNSCCCGSDCCG